MKSVFIKKNSNVIPPKKKKTEAGLPPLKLITIGVKITHREQPNQFIIVANGTTLEGTISGTYSQTTGPKEIP